MSQNKLIRDIKPRPRNPKCGCCLAEEARAERKALRMESSL